MAIEITKEMFVKPREAFQIAGRESFGPSWDPTCVDDEESPLRAIALRNLRAALESRAVEAFCHDFHTQYPLDPQEVAGEFFHINLVRNCVHLSDGGPVECKIRVDDLIRFVREEGRVSAKLTIGDESAFREWLLTRVRARESIPNRAALWTEAKALFPRLSKASYGRVRAHVAKTPGGGALARPGRPKAPKT
jgi:hypothetical protein